MSIDQAISNKGPLLSEEDKVGDISVTDAFTSLESEVVAVHARYAAEREKRLRSDGNSQYILLHGSDKFKHMTEDPWLPADGSVAGIKLAEDERLHFKFVIMGAGYSALLYAARLIEAGCRAEDMILIDYAGGFGGTWYWNRYPGLMCDVAAEVYMPLLEETGYIPKTKYAHGLELLEHAQRIAKQYNISERAIFRATAASATWNETDTVWELDVTQEQGRDGKEVKAIITGDYVFSLAGLLNYPKLPKLPGIESFQGYQFHTSRWDYEYTGGSQATPEMTNLKDKRVAMVGTGATAIQAFPQLAKWAKKLYLVQRTPSAVDVRGQATIQPEKWKKDVANQPGWQRVRRENMAAFLSNVPEKPSENLVDDEWTRATAYAALIGGPNSVDPRDPGSIQSHVKKQYEVDLPRQTRIRARVNEVVQDSEIAERLKAYYPTFCKRPCFHDFYLPTFNQPNVELIDTEGKGIESMTRNGFVVGEKESKVDVIIWASGFSLSAGASNRGQFIVRGREGTTVSEKFKKTGYATLHGTITRGFPNFFVPGPFQAAATANQMHTIEVICEHTIHMIRKAENSHPGEKILIEPTTEAEETWAMRVAGSATALASIQGCTPSYLNAEGALSSAKDLPMEAQIKAARMATWGQGIMDYTRILEDWRADDNRRDLEITVC